MSDKPRILIIIGNLNVGGAERHLLRVMPKINKTEFNVMIYTTNHRGVLADDMELAGVKVIAPPGSNTLLRLGKLGKPITYLISFLYLIRVIKKQKPFIVHYYLPGAYILGSAAMLFCHSSFKVMSRRIIYSDKYRKTLFFKFEKLFHKTLDRVLACSKDISRELSDEGISQSKIDIIYNGIDSNRYIKQYNKQDILTELNIQNASLVMIIVANLYKRKGHIDLLNALKMIKDKLPLNWKLLAIGRDGGERTRLEIITKKYGMSDNIKWLGLQLDTVKVLATADFGILCSHEEGFSNALLECLASQLPMVVTNVSGNNEAVIDGLNGLIVPVANPEKLSQAILQLATRPSMRASMAKNTRQHVETHFALEKVVKSYHAFYLSLLNKSSLLNACKS